MKNFSELKTRDLLTKAQMQSVKGGGTCGYKGPVVNGEPTIICNLTKQEALFFFEGSEEGGGIGAVTVVPAMADLLPIVNA